MQGLDKLLTHYGCSTVVGNQLQLSMELLMIEVGISANPLLANYEQYHFLATDCWLKFLWEKISRFGLRVSIHNIECLPPRVGDRWLMDCLTSLGFSERELIRINRVRLHQQVLFVSDVMDAGGRAIDRRYLERRQAGQR